MRERMRSAGRIATLMLITVFWLAILSHTASAFSPVTRINDAPQADTNPRIAIESTDINVSYCRSEVYYIYKILLKNDTGKSASTSFSLDTGAEVSLLNDTDKAAVAFTDFKVSFGGETLLPETLELLPADNAGLPSGTTAVYSLEVPQNGSAELVISFRAAVPLEQNGTAVIPVPLSSFNNWTGRPEKIDVSLTLPFGNLSWVVNGYSKTPAAWSADGTVSWKLNNETAVEDLMIKVREPREAVLAWFQVSVFAGQSALEIVNAYKAGNYAEAAKTIDTYLAENDSYEYAGELNYLKVKCLYETGAYSDILELIDELMGQSLFTHPYSGLSAEGTAKADLLYMKYDIFNSTLGSNEAEKYAALNCASIDKGLTPLFYEWASSYQTVLAEEEPSPITAFFKGITVSLELFFSGIWRRYGVQLLIGAGILLAAVLLILFLVKRKRRGRYSIFR